MANTPAAAASVGAHMASAAVAAPPVVAAPPLFVAPEAAVTVTIFMPR
jgi:hypothetical protein